MSNLDFDQMSSNKYKYVQYKKREFDLSPLHADPKTKSGLTASQGKIQGIGNMEEADNRIYNALQNMIKQRQQLLEAKKKSSRPVNRSNTQKKTILKKSEVAAPTPQSDLRAITKRLLEQPKYKSMASVKSLNADFPSGLNLNKVSTTSLTPRISSNDIDITPINISASPKSVFEEDKIFSVSKSTPVEPSKDKLEILKQLEAKRTKLESLLNKPVLASTKKPSKEQLHLQQPFLDIKKNDFQPNLKKVEIQKTSATEFKHKINPNILADIKLERKSRLKYLSAAANVDEWNEMQKSIKHLQHELFNLTTADIDNELELLVAGILQKELQE